MREKNKVSRIYMPGQQDVYSDVALLILDEAVVEDEEYNVGVKIFHNLWFPPVEGHLLGHGKVFVVGYGITGYKGNQLDRKLYGSLSEAVKKGRLSERQDFLKQLGWNKKKIVDISDDASFSDDSKVNIRAVSGNIGSSISAGSGFSGALIIYDDGILKKFIGIYSGPSFCETPVFFGMGIKSINVLKGLIKYFIARENLLH
ncbi:MAG: hypothetical protein LBB25_00040 [Holosporaceae bacterium]|nr:hypothetical protein [Holosporaceae bacterium]